MEEAQRPGITSKRQWVKEDESKERIEGQIEEANAQKRIARLKKKKRMVEKGADGDLPLQKQWIGVEEFLAMS